MTVSSSCPPADRLQELIAGTPPNADQENLLTHVGDCAACQQALEALAGADPALLGVARAAQSRTFADEAPLRRVLNDLEGDATLIVPPAAHNRSAWIQSLLQPGEYPPAPEQIDSYRVTEVLGQGGMGVVVKAFDPALDRWVAIKLLAHDLAHDSLSRQRFAREARAAAAVRHEHVITIHAVSEANSVPYFVMEYLAGGSLQGYLDRHGAPGWRAVARLGAEVASGLAAAHARGLIHRDIKPSNILLQAEGGPAEPGASKIGDFGLARVAEESRLTETGIVAGTPMYMSPEQALCQELDERADLFSLGSVLYALCTGREPFPAGSPVAVLRQVCETTPRPIRDLNPAVPGWLAAIVERLHAKKPADRFASAAEVAELLRYNLEHPDHPHLVARPGDRLRAKKRRRLGAAAVLVLLAGGFALSESLHWTHLVGRGLPRVARQDRVALRATLAGHTGPIWSAAFSPDGQTLATGSDDSTVRFWDAATGAEKELLRGHSSAVYGLAFAHSGKFLVSGDSDGKVSRWDAATHKELPGLRRRGGTVRRLSISPDDATVAIGGTDQGVELWDLDNHKLRRTLPGHQGTIRAVAFAPDGRTLATGDAVGHIRLWDPAAGTELANFLGDPIGVRSLAFTPDSKTLASADNGDNDVKLWDVATREKTAALSGDANGVMSVAISPDGRFLATGSRDGAVQIWDLRRAQNLATLHAHQGIVWTVAFSPDSRTLVSVGEDRLGKLWDLGALADASD